eukprot:TRINITY_DN67643_c0_g1_i1.p1 TRINITY_DN67643_c0_g1~~TRINITY_DN67643_c0_g1_i1.p1  ORF type:complete len:469 (-),score=49.80 TRINITY_DN67643_c0_g1_i1:99-1505(-)
MPAFQPTPQFAPTSNVQLNSRASSQYDSFDDDDAQEGSDDSDGDQPWFRKRGFRWGLGGALLLIVGGVLFHASFSGGSASPVSAPVTAPPAPVAREWIPQPTVVPTTTINPLIPVENMNDNNVCDDYEELYGGLCYKKCSILTDGTHPIRTSSWSCCEKHPCGVSNQVGKVGTTLMCDGYDVGYTSRCPHSPGACLTDEELFLGKCYKKCALLTKGEFPSRVAPASCCKSSGMGCLDIRQDKTSSSFAVGGGQGDQDIATPGEVHDPLPQMTENGGTAVLNTQAPTVASGTGGYWGSEARCEYDEELYAGLCYTKCSLLTQGGYPIRTSSWTCCANHPCGLKNQKGSLGSTVACDGFDVSGGIGSSSCPHKPKPCKPGDEEVLGTCFTSCSQLTDGEFPHRTTAATCCKEDGLVACLDPRNTQTSSAYNTGCRATGSWNGCQFLSPLMWSTPQKQFQPFLIPLEFTFR